MNNLNLLLKQAGQEECDVHLERFSLRIRVQEMGLNIKGITKCKEKL